MKSFQLPTGHSARRTQYAGTSRSARGTVKHRLATMTPLGYYCGDGYSCRIRQDQSHTVFDKAPPRRSALWGGGSGEGQRHPARSAPFDESRLHRPDNLAETVRKAMKPASARLIKRARRVREIRVRDSIQIA